jgi:hypothetical protein
MLDALGCWPLSRCGSAVIGAGCGGTEPVFSSVTPGRPSRWRVVVAAVPILGHGVGVLLAVPRAQAAACRVGNSRAAVQNPGAPSRATALGWLVAVFIVLVIVGMAGVLVRALVYVMGRLAVTSGSLPHPPGIIAQTQFFPVEAGVEPPSSIDWGPGLCYCIPENGSAVQWKAHGGVLQGLDRPGFHRLTGAHLPVDAGAPNVI